MTSQAEPGQEETPEGPPTPLPTPSDTTMPPSEALQKIRVVGEVVAVGDCTVVRDDNDITWTVVGELTSDLALGARVAVTGAPDLTATGCGGPLVRVRGVDVLS